MRHIAVLPVLITLLNGICGFAAIHFAARGMEGLATEAEINKLWWENPRLSYFAASAWMIFLAMVADALEGFVARKSGSSSDFGGQLDSLCDVISFGVARAFLMLRVVESALRDTISSADPIFTGFPGRLLGLAAGLYVSCVVLRLARFNVENSPD